MSVNLDDRAAVTAQDPSEMLRLTEEFPQQCRRALEIARQVDLPMLENRPAIVALTGLGGSAAGGDFVRALFEEHGGVPFMVNRDYTLPNFIGLGDIVFCASYSGNTEETLSAYAHAKTLGAKIICVTSGGRLKQMADEDKNPVYVVPGGQPPRTAMGFMLIPVLFACERLKLIKPQDYESAFSLLDKCAQDWTVEGSDAAAKQLASEFHGALPVLYGLGIWQGIVASRWRSQINENSKNLAMVHSFPELNHNEILGWVGAASQSVGHYVGVILEDGSESEKMKARARVTEQLTREAIHFQRIRSRGSTLLERMLSLAFFSDFVSIYLAALNGVDPENIDSINTLKSELGKVQG